MKYLRENNFERYVYTIRELKMNDIGPKLPVPSYKQGKNMDELTLRFRNANLYPPNPFYQDGKPERKWRVCYKPVETQMGQKQLIAGGAIGAGFLRLLRLLGGLLLGLLALTAGRRGRRFLLRGLLLFALTLRAGRARRAQRHLLGLLLLTLALRRARTLRRGLLLLSLLGLLFLALRRGRLREG